MVGENFEICLSEMANNVPNHPPWLEKIEIYPSEMAKNAPNYPSFSSWKII